MKFIVFDTETTGLFNFGKPADDPVQPRLAHLHMIEADASGAATASHDFLILPDETWTDAHFEGLEAESNPNELTREILMDQGVPIRRALDLYTQKIEDGMIVVAFNAQFDCKVMRSELIRAGMDDLFDRTQNICVMRPMDKICNLPHPTRAGTKFPKLQEALEFMGDSLDGAHTADADTEGARKVLAYLIGEDKLPEPAVHRAKPGTKSHQALKARSA